MQHGHKFVVPDARAGVGLRGADGVVRVDGRARRGEGKTYPLAARGGRHGCAIRGTRRGHGVALASAAGVGCTITRRALRGDGTTVDSAGCRGRRLSDCLGGRDGLPAGRRNYANQGGGTQYNEHGDNGGNTHGGLLRLRVTNARCHCNTVSRGRISQVADLWLTRKGDAWRQ